MTLGPFSGGHLITGVSWEGPFALLVRFSTTYSDMLHQFYVGRSLVGWTERADERSLICNVQDSLWPEHYQLLAVDPAERDTDYGALLPPRPYNRVKLAFPIVGGGDTESIEITGSPAPGDPVDNDTILERILYDTDRDYEAITDPLPGSGDYDFEIAKVDFCKPDGNRGDPLAITAAGILAHPPDVEYAADGYNRFTVETDATDVTVSFTEASA